MSIGLTFQRCRKTSSTIVTARSAQGAVGSSPSGAASSTGAGSSTDRPPAVTDHEARAPLLADKQHCS